MYRKYLLNLMLFFVSFSAWALEPVAHCDQTISHNYFSICYSNDHRQAVWTFHKLTKDSIKGPQSRTNDYRFDSKVNGPVGGDDYRHSGFDRGHLVPAGDMKLNRTSMSQSFFMSNMSPQNPAFNRGKWRALEVSFRDHVLNWGEAYVSTGPVLSEGLEQIASGVSIPKFYYKVAYFPGKKVMLAFIMPNERISDPIERFQVSVDEVEARTEIDFFTSLPDEIEERLESSNSRQF